MQSRIVSVPTIRKVCLTHKIDYRLVSCEAFPAFCTAECERILLLFLLLLLNLCIYIFVRQSFNTHPNLVTIHFFLTNKVKLIVLIKYPYLFIGTQFHNLSNILDLSRCTSPFNSLCCTQTSCNWNAIVFNTIQNIFASYFVPHLSGNNTNSSFISISLPNNTDCRFDITSPSWFVHSHFFSLSQP